MSASYQAFKAKGYVATTTDEIAGLCHISKQTLYRYFPSKETLLGAVVAEHRHKMLALPRPEHEDLPFTKVLEMIFFIDLTAEEEEERRAFFRAILRDIHDHPRLRDVFLREGAERSRHELADWLDGQVRRGVITVGNTLSLARMLMDIAFSPMPYRDGEEDRVSHLRQCLALVSHSLTLSRPQHQLQASQCK
ncbi:TetR/AcrR family transcriptional regulator [Allorhizobium sp. BGMRC 0089]|nr:TetR/AcrR family transcriptional regulator [Allorhizobium sonneratiae]